MYSIKFKADVHNGTIKIPQEYSDLESKHIEVVVMVKESQNEIEQSVQNSERQIFSDEYLLQNWQELVSIGLSKFNESYYKSDQYIFDRGASLAEKYK